ncbi:MAG TPA: hypothetical protein VFA11_19910 [Acidimicrobiales bacterium]|nr:hypothetical protein [Acidimicrobiales bacterium]
MRDPFTPPPRNAPDAAHSSSIPVRFQVRPVAWGDRLRYEVVDSRTGTTLVVCSTRHGADGDVMVLNMGGLGGPRVLAAALLPHDPDPPASGVGLGDADAIWPTGVVVPAR